jgi:pyruvate kinase
MSTSSPRRRVKIVCTIGPSTETDHQLEGLAAAGMDVARLNFSHGTLDWHRRRAALIREISARRAVPIGILQDLPGPKVRVGEIPGGPVELATGSKFVLSGTEIDGDASRASLSHAAVAQALRPGDPVLIGDGSVQLEVIEIDDDGVVCRVVEGGEVSTHKGVNLPTRSVALPAMTDRDRECLAAGLDMGVDFVALSFVRSSDDILEAREIMHEHGTIVPIIAKIEKHEALENLDEIVEAADGLLVARGDLAVEIPLERVPAAQKHVIAAANTAGKPVITATQMLRSMVDSPRPTRAEATDVANALHDGTDAVMLSEETAIGSHPAAAVRVMNRICVATEEVLLADRRPRRIPESRRGSLPDAVTAAACLIADHLQADALLVPTRSGATAAKVSSFRPSQPIIAVNILGRSLRGQTATWGVVPLRVARAHDGESLLDAAERMAVEAGLIFEGDLVVITAGFLFGGPGTTNTVIAKVVGESRGSSGGSLRGLVDLVASE